LLIAHIQDTSHWNAKGPTSANRWVSADPVWHSFAEIGETDDSTVVAALIAHAGHAEANELEFPVYDSRHSLHAGTAITATVDGVSVRYVPHNGTTGQPYQHTSTEYQFPQGAALRALALQHAHDNDAEQYSVHAKDLYVCERNGVVDGLVDRYSVPSNALRAIGMGDTSVVEESWEGDEMTYRRMTGEEHETLLPKTWTALPNNRWVLTADMEEHAAEHERIADLIYTGLVEQPLSVPYNAAQSDIANRFEAFAERFPEWSAHGERLFALATSADAATITHEHVEQRAPFSERGKLVVEGATPVQTAKVLAKLGLARRPCKHIPPTLVYPDTERTGRIAPRHPDAARGLARTRPPENEMVIHGLTGVQSPEQALTRFERLVENGGLKSIAERRRQAISVNSLSPIGDIASGIDTGVPCKIGSTPEYGQHIFLGMRPDILDRRDVWFAPRDFGGCETRYDRYNDYARELGQRRFFDPPSTSARKTHLESSERGQSNEVYFKNEVRWSDVDTVFVDHTIASQVAEYVAAQQANGVLPATLRVQNVDEAYGSLEQAITQRAQTLQTSSQ
jgi:hypothetical protein